MYEKGRVTRGTVLVALFLAVLMLGLPVLQFDNHSVSAVSNASAAPARERPLRVSVIELTTAINTLNPLTYTMGQEMDVIWPCYSGLLTYDVNAKLIGDLAESWSSSPDGLTWHFDIVHTATFYNRLDTAQPYHSLTWEDVQYTIYLCRDSRGNSLQSQFPKDANGVNVLGSVTRGADDYSFDVHLNWPYAPFLSAMTIPILPKYIWSVQKSWNWVNYNIASNIAPIVGSGPFYYVLDGMPTASVIELKRNDAWFGTEERGWQMHTTKLVWKSEVSDSSNINDFQNNQTDIMQYVSGDQYLHVLPDIEGAVGQAVSTGFIVEFCANQMPAATRQSLGPPFTHGTNNQILLDPVVREALAMCIDRPAVVADSLDGLGNVGTTLVPGSNPWHYWYGVQPSEAPYGRSPEGEEQVVFNPTLARQKLNEAGWTYDELGTFNPDAYPLAKKYGADVLRFNFFSVNTQPFLDKAARQVFPWMKAAGIDLETLYTVKSSNDANTAWKIGNYDVWMWDWDFSPTDEVSVDIMECFTTMSIGSWNGYFWCNETYNDLYNQSMRAMDPLVRQGILDQMQKMLYETYGVQHIAYKASLYAYSTVNGEKWQNFGDWSAHWTLVPEQLYPWLYSQIYPYDNPSPQVTAISSVYPGFTNSLTAISMSCDDPNVQFRINWGDGTRSGWLNPSGESLVGYHNYTKDGVYPVYMWCRENGTQDSFIGFAQAEARIADKNNKAPVVSYVGFTPSTPTAGDIVTLNCTASDINGDTLYYTWDFGDGYTGSGQTVTHQFVKAVVDTDYYPKVFVDDHHIGDQERPVNKSALVPVAKNWAPTSLVDNYPYVLVRKSTDFNVTSIDPDARDTRRVTWVWGDATKPDVTTLVFGQTKGQVSHTYKVKGDYTLKVWVDDLTGLPEHNVSGQNIVHVADINNKAPKVVSLTASNYMPLTGEVVSVTGKATDVDGDFLTYTFDFGDGQSTVLYGVPENTATTVDHVYEVATTPDVLTVYLTVYDGQAAPVMSTGMDIEVLQGNRDPVVQPLSERWSTIGATVTFTASATDPDGNPLTYWWEFGDGSEGAGNPATHRYVMDLDQVGYRVWVNDGAGANVSKAAYMHVNATYLLDLIKGWNLVTVPVTSSYTANTFPGLVKYDEVVSFNPGTGAYDKVYFKGVPGQTDFPLVAHTGYWIYVGATKTVSLNGTVPTVEQSRPITTPSGGSGWVTVGLMSMKSTMKAYDLAMNYVGASAVEVVTFNPATKQYTAWFAAYPSYYNFTLVPGQGYWLYVSGSGTLSYTP